MIMPGSMKGEEKQGNHTDHQKLSKGVCYSPRQDCNQEAARPSARFSKERLWENSMWFMILEIRPKKKKKAPPSNKFRRSSIQQVPSLQDFPEPSECQCVSLTWISKKKLECSLFPKQPNRGPSWGKVFQEHLSFITANAGPMETGV